MWRNVARPLIWLSIIMAHRDLNIELSGMNEALAISSMAVMLVCLVNFHRKLFIPLEEPVKYLKLALRRMSRYWQYAACSLLTRSHQNLDKLLVAFVMPEATWVVSMVGDRKSTRLNSSN